MLFACRALLNSAAVSRRIHNARPYTREDRIHWQNSTSSLVQMPFDSKCLILHCMSRVEVNPTDTQHRTRATEWGGRKWSRYWCREWRQATQYVDRGTGPEGRKVKRQGDYWWCHDCNHTLVTRVLVRFFVKNRENKMYIFVVLKHSTINFCFHSCSNNFLLFSLTKASRNFTTHTAANCNRSVHVVVQSLHATSLLLVRRGYCNIRVLWVVSIVVMVVLVVMVVIGQGRGKWSAWWRGGEGKPSCNVFGIHCYQSGFHCAGKCMYLKKIG
jgi:hypothetical protein